MTAKSTSNTMSLSRRIVILVTFAIFVSLLATSILITRKISDLYQEKMGQSALSVAAVISTSKSVRDILSSDVRTSQGIIVLDNIVQTNARITNSSIAILDKNGVVISIYSNKNVDEFNTRMQDLLDPSTVYSYEPEKTREYLLDLQALSRVYDNNDKLIGYVVVAFPSNHQANLGAESVVMVILSNLTGLIVGLIGAVFTARSIKSILLGLEPETVAKIVQEQAAILNSVREGVIATDRYGKITLFNTKAHEIFGQAGIEENDYIGKNINKFFAESSMLEVINTGAPTYNINESVNSTILILNILPVTVNKKVVGLVASFRKKTELEELAEQLTGVKNYADALRANTHEFMNKLHVILGLIEMEAYEDLRNYIKELADYQQEGIQNVTKKISNPILSGFIIGKTNRAKELDVEFILTDDSKLDIVLSQDYVSKMILILGNLITNAFDAICNHDSLEQIVFLTIRNFENEIIIIVEDSGPGMSEELQERIFTKNFSTKGDNRGIGLYLVKQTIKELNGTIEIDSQIGQGTIFTIKLQV